MPSNNVSIPVGTVRDVHGTPVHVGNDCDGVSLVLGGRLAILDAAARDEFRRHFIEAERRAQAWAAQFAAEVP